MRRPNALDAVRRAGRLLRAVARWIGQVTVLAGKFPLPAVPGEAPSFARDSEAVPLRRRPMARDGRRAAKRPAAQIAKKPGELGVTYTNDSMLCVPASNS